MVALQNLHLSSDVAVQVWAAEMAILGVFAIFTSIFPENG